MIKYLFWDAGGTLFDTYPAVVEACRVALSRFGEDASPERVRALFKQSTSFGIRTLAEAFSLDEDDLMRHFERAYEGIGAQYQPPFPGVAEACRYVCEIGGSNFVVTHRAKTSLQALLEAHNLVRYFSDCITKEDPYPRKPDPGSLNALIMLYALDRDRCLLIGDRDLDIVAGQRAGIHTCFFGSEPHETQPDLTIIDYAALRRWLLAANADLRGSA